MQEEERRMQYLIESNIKLSEENKANIEKLETKVETLEKSNIKLDLTLNNLLICFGELKESIGGLQSSISSLKEKPATYWNKLVFAVIGAGGAAIVTMLVK